MPPPDEPISLDALTAIRTETALSRYPIHRLAKKGEITIDIQKIGMDNATALLWEVSYNSKYGQPGPLAYKLDTIIVNRRIEEAIERGGGALGNVIKLGSLRDICRELGNSEGGESVQSVKRALLQNASAFINAKITYKTKDPKAGTAGQSERSLEAAFTRYSVIFTGESLPDGRKADAVYLILADVYRDVLAQAVMRPLDYDYLKSLPPSAQRFYEVVSYQVYAALRYNNPRAKLSYAEYCLLSTQTRYLDWDHVKKQMYKVHLPHLRAGYIAKIEYEEATDAEGQPDWIMYYTPGPNAAAEYRAFMGGGNRAVQRLTKPPERPRTLPLAFSEAPALPAPDQARRAGSQPYLAADDNATGIGTRIDTEVETGTDVGPEGVLVAALVAQGVGRTAAQKLAVEKPEVCWLHLDLYMPYLDALATRGEFVYRNGKGAYLYDAIRSEYGPPKGYDAAHQREQDKQARSQQAVRQQARINHAEAFRTAYEAYLEDILSLMPQSQPDAFASFLAQEETEREKLKRIGFSLKKFDTQGQRLVRFRQFFTGQGVLEFWDWDRDLNPEKLAIE